MKCSGLTTQGLLVCCILLVSEAIFAAELGNIHISSSLGKILDVRIDLSGTVTEDMWLLFRQASAEEYRRRDLEYSELHSRLLIDPVLSENPPYIAVSSIGSVNRENFTLVLENLSAAQPKFRQYEIVLAVAPKIVPIPKKKRIIGASEVLWQLLTILGPERGLSRSQAMAELEYLRAGRGSEAADRHIIFHLEESDLTQEFTDGLVELMSAEERQAFDKTLEQGRSVAVSEALFAASGQALLARLLNAGIARNAASGSQDSNVDMRVQMKALQNKLVEMESVRESDADELQDAVSVPENVITSNLRDWLFSRNTWIIITAIWMLLFIWVLLPRFFRR